MSSKLAKAFKYLTDADYRFVIDSNRGKYDDLDDEEYLKRRFKARVGRTLDLDDPKTFNEKMQWLKLYDRRPLYTTLVDKYAVKQYVADIIGAEYIIPTLGVWDHTENIDFDALPNQFVLKCTHDSHGLVICTDKSKLDIEEAKKKLTESLGQDYYLRHREWPYKNVPRKIIAEKYLEDVTGFLTDYKFYCFNGKADCVLTCFDRSTGDTKFYFFDRNWELKRYNKRGKEAPEGFTKPKPEGIDKMFDLAEVLAKTVDAPFLRVDLYNVYGKIYFGELTLYPQAGFDTNRLPEMDLKFGSMLDLSKVKK